MNRLSDTHSRRRLLQTGGHAWLSGSVSRAVCGTLATVAAQRLTATILHLLGVSHEAMFPDPAGRPLRVVEGDPIAALL